MTGETAITVDWQNRVHCQFCNLSKITVRQLLSSLQNLAAYTTYSDTKALLLFSRAPGFLVNWSHGRPVVRKCSCSQLQPNSGVNNPLIYADYFSALTSNFIIIVLIVCGSMICVEIHE